MMGEFLARLALALPLVCLAAVLCLLAVKRGWIELPSFARRPGAVEPARQPQQLELMHVKSLGPTARVAVIRFDGKDHLVGVSAQNIALLATADLPARPATPSQIPNPAANASANPAAHPATHLPGKEQA